MKRLALLGIALGAMVVPAGAMADQPTREPLPVGPFTFPNVCGGFDVLLEPLQENETLMTFTDESGEVVKLIVTGALRLRLTNLDTGKSIVVNVPGPQQIRIGADGPLTNTAVGPWIHLTEEGLLVLTRGQIVLGEPFETLRGTSVDLCALLADP